MSTYLPAIPQPGDNLSKSQADLLGNFRALDAIFAVNHFAFSDGSVNKGKHTFVEMPIQALPATLASEGSLYTNTAGQSQLFYTADAGGNAYQLTRCIDAQFSSKFGANTPGWSFLPGGLLIQWGVNTCASGTTILFPVEFSSEVYSIQCTIFQATTNRHFVYVRSQSTASFVTTQLDSGGSGESNTFSWVAIGV